MDKLSVYIDSNVLVDWIIKRKPFYDDAILIIALIESAKISGVVSALGVANAYFIIQKYADKTLADKFTRECLKHFHFIDNNKEALIQAIQFPYKDFEDDIHFYSVIDAKISAILTRNKKDFPKQDMVRIFSPAELLVELGY